MSEHSEYIRTKNKILNVDTIKFMESIGVFDKEMIKEEANTIKELCDEFVLRSIDIIFLNKNNTQYRFGAESVWHDITDTQIKIGIYGAVWTDNGLIYVAKMNEQRELKLI